MTAPSNFGDPSVVPTLIADWIIKTSGKITGVDRVYLSDAISEITVQTQTLGAALLQVTLIDPAWKIARSGLCDTTDEGLLQPVDVNFPEGTDVWWRLAMVDVSEEFQQPNLTLTFQQRIWSYMMDCTGPVTANSGLSTRAEFIKQLVDKVPHELPKNMKGSGDSPIIFVCPDLHQLQPLASSSSSGGTTVVIPGATAAGTQASVNKTSGPAFLVPASAEDDPPGANGACGPLPADRRGYSVLSASGTSSDAGTAGQALSVGSVWPCGVDMIITNPANHKSVRVHHVDNGAGSDAILPVVGLYPQTRADLGLGNAGSYHVIIQRADGQPFSPARGTPAAGASGVVSSPTSSTPAAGGGSDVSQLTRGTPENPDEDTASCCQRLAAEVNWMFFSSPSPSPGVWGNYLYYIDGPTLVAQKPAAYISLSTDGTTWSAKDPKTGKVVTGGGDGMITNLSGTLDDTAFLYQQTQKRKGKTSHKTRIRTPQTPSQIRFNMLSGVMQFNAGDVFVFQNAGPLSGNNGGSAGGGRWIVEDVTQNSLGDLFGQFTLGPPTYPYPEPQANSTTVLGPNGQPVNLPVGSPFGKGSVGAAVGSVGLPTGSFKGLVSPFTKKYSASLANTDMGVDFGRQQGINTGDSILAIGDCYLRSITTFYQGQPGMWFEFTPPNKQASGYWGWYVAEEINPKLSAGPGVIKAGTVVATYAVSGTGIEIGWAAAAGVTATLRFHPGEAAGRHSGNGTTDGRNFLNFLQHVGAV